MHESIIPVFQSLKDRVNCAEDESNSKKKLKKPNKPHFQSMLNKRKHARREEGAEKVS